MAFYHLYYWLIGNFSFSYRCRECIKKNEGKPPVKHLMSGNSHRQKVGRCRQKKKSQRSAVTPCRMRSPATSSRGVKPSAKNRGNVTPRTLCGSHTFTSTQTKTRTRALPHQHAAVQRRGSWVRAVMRLVNKSFDIFKALSDELARFHPSRLSNGVSVVLNQHLSVTEVQYLTLAFCRWQRSRRLAAGS